MKISIVNGSPRKNGATSKVLNMLKESLEDNNSKLEIEYYNLSNYNFKTCIGCEKCYQTGKCTIDDGFEKLAISIKDSDGVIIGSPTHGSNVSALLKNFMDRGHFIVEQSLYNKICFPVATYEIADGISTYNLIKKFFVVSGGIVRNKLLFKVDFNKEPKVNQKSINKQMNQFIKRVETKSRKPFFQFLFNDVIVVNLIWKSFFRKHKMQYAGVVKNYKKLNIHKSITKDFY